MATHPRPLILLPLLLGLCGCNLRLQDPDTVAEVLGTKTTRNDTERVLHSEIGQRIKTEAPNPEKYAQGADRESIRELRARIWRPLLDQHKKKHRLHATADEIRQSEKAEKGSEYQGDVKSFSARHFWADPTCARATGFLQE